MIPFLLVTAFLLIVAVGIIMLVLVYQKRQLQYLGEKEQLKVTYEKQILESKLEIQEQTLKNISQEIHDNIGQVLSLAKLHINTMDTNDPASLQEKISGSKTLITKAIRDLRDLSKSLNTDYVNELGLVRAIEHELDLIKKTGSYGITFSVEHPCYRLEEQQELIFFRIFQEAVHNIIRHAKARFIKVHLLFDPAVFTLSITDDGTGFDDSKLATNNYYSSGLGIRNMYNRANIIKADYRLQSAAGKGTTINVSLAIQTPKL